jgi:ketosteroid isomerase-like protein
MNAPLCRHTAALFVSGLFLLITGCRVPSSSSSSSHTAEIERVTRVDADWVKAAQTHSPDAWMAFYAPDAVVLPPNDRTIDNSAAIKAYIAGLLGLKDLVIDWKPTKVFVSDAGDMAWLYGAYSLQAKEPSGLPMSDIGKIAEIWRKQPDGSWKCVLDTWSSDLPVLTPEKK